MTAATAAHPRTGVEDIASRLHLLAMSEVALTLVTLAAVVGLRRVFIGGDWLVPLVLQAVGAHGLSALLRRRQVGPFRSAAALLGASALSIAWVHAGDTTAFGVPTGETISSLLDAVDEAATAFSEITAPTEALPGFLIVSSLAIWVCASIADWAAFRVDASIEAVLPSASFFVVVGVIGADVDRVLVATLWILAVLSFLLFRRADRLGRTSTWVGERRRAGPRSLLVVGAALTAVALALAVITGPRLPGATSEGLVDPTDIGDDGPGARVTVSPLVDIQSRLVDQADVEVFTVRSPVRAYWRLTSLDRFDGRIWSSNGSYGSADGELDEGVPVASERIRFDQSFAIGALAQIWLPAAYEPRSVDASQDVRYDEVSGTLIVDTDIETADGTTYQVTSALPEHDPASLAAASRDIPGDIAERYLDLPGDFPTSVRALAASVTEGSTSAYESARRLQDFFRSEFEYDLDVQAGHGEQAIERFLFDLRRGYCEQFAGSYAAMARSLGIPARVAVGFTPGVTDADDPSLYRVQGRFAHAWPEVYLGEFGWVAFEPTPGRGAPFAEQYTGVPEQQATPVAGDPTGTTIPETPPSIPDVPADSPPGADPDQLPQGQDPGTEPPADGAEDGSASPWLGRALWVIAVLAVLVALYVVVVLTVPAWRRRRRRESADLAPEQVAVAWEELLGTMRRAGLDTPLAETPAELATRVGARLPELETPVRTLAITVQDSTYSPIPTSAEVAEQALALAQAIDVAAWETMTATERLRARLHPNRLLTR